jgi:anaerobic magnesium-protoporphyrin IX monomethyl ester cyclase
VACFKRSEPNVNVLLIDVSPFGESVTPVSLGHVAAVLAERGHTVEILSIGVRSTLSPARLRKYLEERRPRLVGFGTYQRNLRHVLGFARLIKQTLPAVSVVLGGPQATFMPDEGFAVLPDVDFLCRGEGESVIVAIAEAIEGDNERAVPGATRRTLEGQILTGPPLEAAGDLDRYPSPWLSGILDPSAMSESIVLTSRGCPHDCIFCYTPAAFARKIRCNSLDRVLDEVSYIAARGTGRFWFADPNFSFSEERVTAILDGILRRGLAVEMWIETRADLLNPALLRLMKRAGVYLVALGLESASPNVFPHLGKRLQPEEVRTAVRLAFDAGIDVELFSQYALPNERREDALATLQFVQDCGVQIRGNSNAQQMQLYFGSKICADYVRHGVIPLRASFPPYLSIGAEFATRWMSREDIEGVKNAWRAASLDGGKRVVS